MAFSLWIQRAARHGGVILLPGALTIVAACREKPSPLPAPASAPLARGDRVVVEHAAAEFFEARILSVASASLKVQTAEEGEPVVVSRSDAYRVPVEAATLKRGDYAVCNEASTRWVPCRVAAVQGGALRATLPSGDDLDLDGSRVIALGPVTALNVERYLDSVAAQRRFLARAAGAGAPPRPSHWAPEPREPVLARNGTDWFSAHAVRALADGGVEVALETAEHPVALSGANVVPSPPFAHRFVAGEFVLLRAETPGQAWQRALIEAVGPDEAVVVSATGAKRRVSVRSLVPLSAPGAQ